MIFVLIVDCLFFVSVMANLNSNEFHPSQAQRVASKTKPVGGSSSGSGESMRKSVMDGGGGIGGKGAPGGGEDGIKVRNVLPRKRKPVKGKGRCPHHAP